MEKDKIDVVDLVEKNDEMDIDKVKNDDMDIDKVLGRLAIEAAQLMEQHLISQLIVVDEDSQNLVGAINMHDLLQAKVI